MRQPFALIATAMIFLAVAAMPARADDRATVEAFYSQLLSATTSPDLADRIGEILSPDWQSIGDYSGKIKSRDEFTGQLQGFGKLIPDMVFEVQEIVQSGDRFIVRSRATGTPADKLFGIPASGKGFDVMAIDIHTVKDGKITLSYHVEDWARAMQQLSAK